MTDGVIVEKIPVRQVRLGRVKFYLYRDVKFWFGMYVWQSISEQEDLAYEDFGEMKDQEKFVDDVLYYAAEYGSLKDRRKILNKEAIQKARKLMPQGQLQNIIDVMLNSKVTGGSIIGNVANGLSKKKQATKK